MKVLLIYFTGTYNTRFLARKLARRFGEENTQTVEIDASTPIVDTKGYDLIGFSYPIYGFNMPRPFERYVKKLKFEPRQKYFIAKNSGETLPMNNASSRRLIRYMTKQKADFCGEYHFVFPYNIHFPFPEDFIRESLQYNQKLLDILFYNLERGIAPSLPSKWIHNLGAFFVSIQHIGGDINSFFYRIDKEKCTRCGLCATRCPQKNIDVTEKGVKFHHHCDMCMRCSFYCPQRAIRIGLFNSWLVHDYYDLNELEKKGPDKPYITPETKGFYRCYIPYFENIQKQYEAMLSSVDEGEQSDAAHRD